MILVRKVNTMSVYLSLHSDYRHFCHLRSSIIVLEGLIAVGKSTLGLSLFRYLNRIGIKAKWFSEDIPKSLLDLYLSDQKKYAFAFQTIIAKQRIQIYKDALKLAKKGVVVIIDRGLSGDFAFATMQKDKGFFTKQEFYVYLNLISEKYPEPNYTIYLNCSPQVCFERLKFRGNQAEINGYTLKYFQDLKTSYEKIIDQQKNGLILLDWESHTTIKHGMIGDELCKEVLKSLTEVTSKIFT